MPLRDGFIQPSISPHQPSSRSARCLSARASMTRMTTLCQSARAFTQSGRQSGNLILPLRQPSNGWGRGDPPSFKLIMEIPSKLKEYIDNNRGSLPPVTDPEEPLEIDSLSVIRLVAFLENELGYRIEDEELIAENFETLRKLGTLLASKEPTQVASPVQPNIVTFIARRTSEDPEVSKS